MRSAVMRASSRFALPCARLACACSIDGLRLLDRRLRLVDLLIELRRVDFGEDLARRHAVADIGEAALEVAVGARQNRRLGQRLHRAGQLQHVLIRGRGPPASPPRAAGPSAAPRLRLEASPRGAAAADSRQGRRRRPAPAARTAALKSSSATGARDSPAYLHSSRPVSSRSAYLLTPAHLTYPSTLRELRVFALELLVLLGFLFRAAAAPGWRAASCRRYE